MFKFKFKTRGHTVAEPSSPTPASPGVGLPAARRDHDGAERMTVAAGCFWGVEAAFRDVHGVVETAVGYTGGHVADPTYQQVCGHRTGHAEAVEVWFDPAMIGYAELLETFWRIHNPTTRNRQGFDFGNQYRSAIFFHDAEQESAATASLANQQQTRRRRIVTEIVGASRFYRAEEYHQRYMEQGGRIAQSDTLYRATDQLQ